MMKRLVLLLALAGCAKHPAITAGVAGGVIGFAGCEIDSVSLSTCGAIGATAAAALGGITWLVTTLFDTEDHAITFADEDELTPQGGVKVHTQTALPPVPVDAGLADAPLADVQVLDARVVDAPVPPGD